MGTFLNNLKGATTEDVEAFAEHLCDEFPELRAQINDARHLPLHLRERSLRKAVQGSVQSLLNEYEHEKELSREAMLPPTPTNAQKKAEQQLEMMGLDSVRKQAKKLGIPLEEMERRLLRRFTNMHKD